MEIGVSIILVLLLAILVNPFHVFMSNSLVMMIIGGIILLFSIFVGLVWREKPSDERESLHRMLADRIAFLVGSFVLVVGIVIQNLRHAPHLWLILVLGIMVLAKLIGLLYSRSRF